MKKFILILLALCAFAMAQGKQTVAIVIVGDEPKKGTHKQLASYITQGIIQSGDYKAVDRTDAALKSLKKAHGYQRGGAVSDDQIKKLGAQFGEQLLCLIEITDTDGEYFLEAKLVDIESSEVPALGNANSRLANNKAIKKAADEIKEQLFDGGGAGVRSSNTASEGDDENAVFLKIDETLFGQASDAFTDALQNLLQSKGCSVAEKANEGTWQLRLKVSETKVSEIKATEGDEAHCYGLVKGDLYNNDDAKSTKINITGSKVGWTDKATACEKALAKAAEAVWESVEKKVGCGG
ncbi:hypothetical protein AGMMS49938_17750 [Fibrobacterales bacterium]|nr:hypothetical protein AGMMS49938_17750 [Fibrobacterales bacterium]